jgi:hypothetical protein
MIRTQISLEPDEYRELKAEAKRQGLSVAELMRRALAEVLRPPGRRRGRAWMRFAGVLSSGDPDASRTADEVVYGRPRP